MPASLATRHLQTIILAGLAVLSACAPPNGAVAPDLVGRWVVRDGLPGDLGAELVLSKNGRAEMLHWPKEWEVTVGEPGFPAKGWWTPSDRGDDAVGYLGDINGHEIRMPIYFSRTWFGRTCIEFGVRDHDSGLPCFQRQPANR
jgi:hypothetical protein